MYFPSYTVYMSGNSFNLKIKGIHNDMHKKICTFWTPVTECMTISFAFPPEFKEYFIPRNIFEMLPRFFTLY